ncbi:MAG: hypothetical protein KL863_14985 [Rhizobium sp.]|nr:hypothetical protein [Rhizobium sp.]
MHRHILRVFLLVLISAVLAACGSKPRQTVDTRMFDVRGVGVTANGGVPAGIIIGIRRQMEMAVEATTHAVPKIRAVMNIHVASVIRDRNGHARTELSVTISDVGSGQPVLVRSYLVLASSEVGRTSDAAIADAVASRLRYEYALSMPQLRPVLRHDPALSTRLGTETGRKRKSVDPIVIPLKTAPMLGADQDPVLNSKTRVDPVADPARVEPAVKATKIEPEPAQATVESGAKAKVVIKPQATEDAAEDEPCVETLERKC